MRVRALMCRLGLHRWVYRRAQGSVAEALREQPQFVNVSERRCTIDGCARSTRWSPAFLVKGKGNRIRTVAG